MELPSRNPPPASIQLLLIPVLFFAAAKLSLAFAIMPDVLVMLWLPNGILLATLLHYGLRRYLPFVAAILIAEVAADYGSFSVPESVSFGFINVLEATAAYLMLRRWRFDASFASPADLGKFLIAGPTLAATAAAVAAGGVYRVYGGDTMSYLQFVQVWWLSDGLGMLMMTPLVLSIWRVQSARPVVAASFGWYDAVAAAVAVAMMATFLMSEGGTFMGWPFRPVLLLPLAIYAAARLTPRWTAVVVAFIALAVLFVTANGQRPYGDVPLQQTILQAQQFLAILAIGALGLSSLLAQLRANVQELEVRVSERTAELRDANAQLLQLAGTDPLTGVANRRALLDAMRHEMERSRRHPHDLAVIIFDIDRFKAINDHHGHAVGDRVIRHVADVASRLVRSTDLMARYGGEEFVVLAPETDLPQALRLAERMRVAVHESAVAVDQQILHVTASFGVALLQNSDTEAEALLARADAALYAAKAAGRDRTMTAA